MRTFVVRKFDHNGAVIEQTIACHHTETICDGGMQFIEIAPDENGVPTTYARHTIFNIDSVEETMIVKRGSRLIAN